MGREILKTPDYWYWSKDWANAIKTRTGWTEEELAERIGTSSRNLRNLINKPPTGRTLLLLRLLKEYKEKTGQDPMEDIA
jgi:hypothetical protein